MNATMLHANIWTVCRRGTLVLTCVRLTFLHGSKGYGTMQDIVCAQHLANHSRQDIGTAATVCIGVTQSEDTAKVLIKAFINIRLHYCNSLYFGIADGLMSGLQ